MPRCLHPRAISLLRILAIGCASATGAAIAAPCYVVLDREDAVVYQSPHPPVDMSTAGMAARDAMRSRGDVMLNFDTANCPVRIVASRSGRAEATVDEIVAAVKPYKTARANKPVISDSAADQVSGEGSVVVNIGR